MSLNEYYEIFAPLMAACLRKRKQSDFKKMHLWYLYRQAFYGLGECLQWNAICCLSTSAASEFSKLRPSEELRALRWSDQPSFDPGRKLFHLEHIYTGDMFRAAVESAAPTIDAASFAELVTNNFAVAWILKSENASENLRKSYRGVFLIDALQEYRKAGIQLLPPLIPSVVSEKVSKVFPGMS